MKRKFIALALCLALIMSITAPSTLAMGIASDSSNYNMSVETTPSEETVLPDATPVADNAESTPDAVEPPSDEAATAQPDSSAQPEADETVPEVDAPASSAAPTPTASATVEPSATPAADAEQPKEPASTAAPVASEAPAATAEPAASAEPAALSSEQVNAIYNDLMAASTLEEMENVLASLNDAELNALVSILTAEQIEQVNNKAASFAQPMSTPTPEEVDDRSTVYPAQNVTNAAPFLPPVSGMDPNAEDDRVLSIPSQSSKVDAKGLETRKTVSVSENGQYTLTLEAWATGEKTITNQETQIPTDIVLVLDQSGSMTDEFNSFTYEPYSGNPAQLYQKQNSLYVKRSDGSYAPVTVKKGTIELDSYVSFSSKSNFTYHSNSGTFYHKCSDGNYGLVTVDHPFLGDYTYSCQKCNWSNTSSGYRDTPAFSESFYKKDTANGYTFSYKDLDGKTVTATVQENESAPTWDFHISKPGPKTTRIKALKKALTTFTDSVKSKSMGPDGTVGTADDVNHRIAIVGFASGKSSNNEYKNSELFVGSKQYNYNTLGLSDTSKNDKSNRGQFKNAFQNMNETGGQNNVALSVNSLDANGATNTHYGMEMAKTVLEENPVPNGEKRNRVVIVFTDGSPTANNGFHLDVANSAISYANQIKNMGKTADGKGGTTVYSVGIFEGANASSAGAEPRRNLDNTTSQAGIDACNWFMQKLSSNDGVVQNPSYYLSAADSESLNNIFESISENIENGGSTMQLGSETVLKDVISDYFQLPAGSAKSAVKVYTADYIGENTFSDKEVFNNATVALSPDGKNISVTNFDYSENWVGTVTTNGETRYRGKKLIVEIPIVVRDGFLGGNGVPTNKADSGIYTGDTVIENFPIPTTDVSIPDIQVTATDKNIYLTQQPDENQLLEGATVQCGKADINLKAENYGLEPWQTDFVTLNHSVTPPADTINDSSYTVTFTVSPKTLKGSATEKSHSDSGKINVFKPEITYQDSTINYGEIAHYETQNTPDNNVVWKHGDNSDQDVSMIGDAPTLDFTYSPLAGAFKEDTNVTVTVKIGDTPITEHVTFINNSTTHEGAMNHQFTVYVQAYTLTIQKTANAPGVFKFNVKNDAQNVDMNVVIRVTDDTINKPQAVTIKGLPNGTYTVTEDTNWSWNFTPDQSFQTVVLTGDPQTAGTATFKNTLKNKWLNDSVCVKNVPGMSTAGTN